MRDGDEDGGNLLSVKFGCHGQCSSVLLPSYVSRATETRRVQDGELICLCLSAGTMPPRRASKRLKMQKSTSVQSKAVSDSPNASKALATTGFLPLPLELVFEVTSTLFSLHLYQSNIRSSSGPSISRSRRSSEPRIHQQVAARSALLQNV